MDVGVPGGCEALGADKGGWEEGWKKEVRGKGEWKFLRRVGKVHLRSKCKAGRDTEVVGEARKKKGRVGLHGCCSQVSQYCNSDSSADGLGGGISR